MLVVNKLETIIAIARMKTGTFGTAFTNRWRRSPRDSTWTALSSRCNRALWPVNFPLRRSIVGRGILCDQRALGIR